MKSNITGLAHIGVFVKDINKSIDFYERLGFNLDQKDQHEGTPLAILSAGTCILELVGIGEERVAGVIDHIAVTVDSVDEAVSNAKANGIDIDASLIENMPLFGGIRNIFFAGPDGERIEFLEYTN